MPIDIFLTSVILIINNNNLKPMKDKSMILKFKGNKAEIHRQLKSFCALADKTLNGTVLEAIQLYLEQNSPKNIAGQNGEKRQKGS